MGISKVIDTGPISFLVWAVQIEESVILALKANSKPPWNFLTWNVSFFVVLL